MLENNKYYIPTIEEFHVGFEFEFSGLDNYWNKLPFEKETVRRNKTDYYGLYTLNWVQKIFDDKDYPVENFIRVKHLDQQDIEELGWDKAPYTCPFTGKQRTSFFIQKEIGFNTGTLYTIKLSDEKKINNLLLEISAYGSWGRDENKLYLTIKNKSELRKLMQTLGI